MPTTHVFVSYSHTDRRWVKKGPFGLIPWLSDQLRRFSVQIWHDHALQQMPGAEFKKQIKSEIDRAQMAILLISQDFVTSEFIQEYELPWIRDRYDRNELELVPILVQPVISEDLGWLADKQILPGMPKPLIRYTRNESIWADVRVQILETIRNRIKALRSSGATSGLPDDGVTGTATASDSTVAEPSSASPEKPCIAETPSAKVDGSPRHSLSEPEPEPLSQPISGVIQTKVFRLGEGPRIPRLRIEASKLREVMRIRGHTGGVERALLLPDGKRCVSVSVDRTLRTWDLETISQVWQFNAYPSVMTYPALTPDGQEVACAVFKDPSVRIWCMANGHLERLLGPETGLDPVAIAISHDGCCAAVMARSWADTYILRVFDYNDGRQIGRFPCDCGMRGFAFSPDGGQLCLVPFPLIKDHRVSFVSPTTGEVTGLLCSPAPVSWFSFSPKDRYGVTAGLDGAIRVWDLERYREILCLTGHVGLVVMASISPDGQRILSCGADRTARLWSVEDGRELCRLIGHDGVVSSVDFSQDGSKALTASQDGTIRLWELPGGT